MFSLIYDGEQLQFPHIKYGRPSEPTLLSRWGRALTDVLANCSKKMISKRIELFDLNITQKIAVQQNFKA